MRNHPTPLHPGGNPGGETVTLHRQLTPRQRDRRRRILDAATQLASEGGYEAVAMKDVAARAGVSLGTLYRYFASKDHLLAEALLAWGRLLGERLAASPPRGRTPAARVASVFRRMAHGVARQPELAVALTRALLSRDPGAFANVADLRAMMAEWISVALADEPLPDRAAVIDLLEHVCFSCMVGFALGQRSPREVGEEIARASHALLGR